jgi:putative transposase
MSRRGNCWDNAPIESFFGHLKDEVNIKVCKTLEEKKDDPCAIQGSSSSDSISLF